MIGEIVPFGLAKNLGRVTPGNKSVNWPERRLTDEGAAQIFAIKGTTSLTKIAPLG
ncbi:MAG TPA: hypothetical protein VKS78_01395 [Roseiarcus sp.]|nr:hypothetical protein [Roseiarcus sp.]